jgi:hypothetical protein
VRINFEIQGKADCIMSRTSGVILFSLCAGAIALAQQTEVTVQNGTVVPAGTLLACTLDEPNFSSRTAQIGDPVLCHLKSIEMFGRPLIPRGAYLSARLQDYRDPGHFFGKGWLQLEFTSLTLPHGSFPLSAKVISADHYRVQEGKIKGHGHPTRDLVEWTIPILWPMKVLTLPARGPRPTLKGETRIKLRLMDDILLPELASVAANGLSTKASASLLTREGGDASLPRRGTNVLYRDTSLPTSQPMPISPTQIVQYPARAATNQAQISKTQPLLTLIAVKDGRVYLVVDYRVDNGNLEFTTHLGARQAVPLEDFDFPLTGRLNAERGWPFRLN